MLELNTMKKHLAIIFTGLVLSGCASDIYGTGLFGQKVVGNEYSVTVDNIWNANDGLPLAKKHCQEFNKFAFITGFRAYVGSYDCVSKSISGNKNYVTLSLYGDESEALPYAENHCSKFGRSAKYKSKEKYKVLFDCVNE
jgi:hypothetical protein